MVGIPAATPAGQIKPRYNACDASPPPLIDHEASLAEAGQRGALRTWSVDIPKAVISRTQGGCGVAREVMRDVLRRSAGEASRRDGGGDGLGGPYQDMLKSQQNLAFAGEVCRDQRRNTLTMSATLQSSSQPHYTTSKVRAKGKLEVKQGWRSRLKRALSVPAFRIT